MPIDKPLCPATASAIASIARRLRNLPCDNSLVAMNLHRVARDLEAIVAGQGAPDRCGCSGCAAAPGRVEAGFVAPPTLWSAQECRE